MVFYNIKKLCCIFLYVFSIVLFLLIAFSTSSYAETYPTGFTDYEIQLLENCWNDYKDTYDTYTCFKDSNDYIIINVFNRPEGFKVSRNSGNNVFNSNLAVVGSGYWIKIYLNDGHRSPLSFSGITSNVSNWQNGAYPLWR